MTNDDSSAPAYGHRVTRQQRQHLQQIFERGRNCVLAVPPAHQRAHELFVECLSSDPGNTVYVEALLQNLEAMHASRRRAAPSFWRRLLLRYALRRAARRENWERVLRLGPQALAADPGHAQTLCLLAEACRQCDLLDAEHRYLRRALESAPNDPVVNRRNAQALAKRGQFSMALECWRQVHDAVGDPQAARMIAVLSCGPQFAEQRQSGERRALPELAEPAEPGEPGEPAELGEPRGAADGEPYRQRAQACVENGRFDEAEAILRRAAGAAPGDWQLREQLEDLECRRKQRQITIAEQLAAEHPTDKSFRQLVEHFREDLNRLEIELFDQRAQRYPDQPNWRWELARRLKRAGLFDQAVRLLQDPPAPRRWLSDFHLEIGECRQHQHQFEQALEHYLLAAEEAQEGRQRRLPLYRAGLLAAGMQQVGLARETLSRLLAIDPNFRDAADRLDKLDQIGNHG